MDFLQGHKTVLVAITLGIATALKSLGYIDDSTYQTIMGLLGSAGLVTLRAAITANGTKADVPSGK